MIRGRASDSSYERFGQAISVRWIRQRGLRLGRVAMVLTALSVSLSGVTAWAAPTQCVAGGPGEPTPCDGPPIERLERSAVAVGAAPLARPTLESVDALTKPRSTVVDLGQAGSHGGRLDGRAMALLRQEIAGIHRLLQMTPATSDERPELLQRLGDRYVELELGAHREADDFERRALVFDQHQRPRRAEELRRQARDSERLASLARRQAIDVYASRLAEAPDWCEPTRLPAGGAPRCGDDVLYRMAGAYVRAGEGARARWAFAELERRWPRSDFASRAALGHAELSFEAARTDPARWPATERAFSRLVRRLPSGSATRAYATYKLGHVYWHQGEFDQALRELGTAFEAVSSLPRLPPGARSFAQAIRRDLVSVFAVVGAPSDAYPLFAAVASDRTVAIELLEQLGQTYLDVGLFHRAEQIYSDLMSYNGGASACGYQAKAAYARLAADPSDRIAVTAKLRDLLRTQRTFRVLGVEPALQEHCRSATVSLLTETARRWHSDARAAVPRKGPGAGEALAASAALYRLVLANFTDGELRAVPWSGAGVVGPLSRASLGLALADVAALQGRWLACGRAFERLVAADGATEEQRQDAVLGAAECYLEALETGHDSATEERGASAVVRAMTAAFDRYACRVKPPVGSPTGLSRYARIQMARGRLHARAGRLHRAAQAYRSAAIEHGGTSSGAAAGSRYLDAVLRLGGDRGAPQPHCFDEAAEDVRELQRRYCTGADLVRHAEQCRHFARVEYDLVKHKARALLASCEGDGGRARAACLAAAELYAQAWVQQGAPACANEGAECLRSASLLYYGARAFERAGKPDRADALRVMLVDPRHHLTGTVLAQRALGELAASYRSRGRRAEAASAYERLARIGQGDRSRNALAEAIWLRLDLGQLDGALRHAEQFHRRYARSAERQTATVAVAVADRLARHGRWADAKQLVSLAEGTIRRSGSLEARVLAHAVLGRASAGLGHYAAAARAYRAVAAMWQDEPSRLQELARLGGSAEERGRRHAQVVAAVAESLLFIAERRRRQVEVHRVPRYRGAPRRRAVEQHVRHTVTAWIAERRRAMAPAEAAYARLLALDGGSPPLAYALLARLALGQMWADLVMAIRGAPHPRRWNRSGYVPGAVPPLLWAELRAAYRERLWAESLPFEERATRANERCVALGARQGRPDAVQVCQQRLTELAPRSPGPIEPLAVVAPRSELAPTSRDGAGKPAVTKPTAKSPD